jgi:hypothetical protein
VSDAQTEQELPRIAALREAAGIVNGERDAAYGSPEDNFARIAKLWTVIFEQAMKRGYLEPSDVAAAMIAVKLSRQTHGNTKDNWVDIAGYAACGYEVSLTE